MDPRGFIAFAVVVGIGSGILSSLDAMGGRDPGDVPTMGYEGSGADTEAALGLGERTSLAARGRRRAPASIPGPTGSERVVVGVVVRVETSDGHGVAGARIATQDAEGRQVDWGDTDSTGTLGVEGLPIDGSLRIGVVDAQGLRKPVPLTASAVVLSTVDALSLTVEVVDAETGEGVDAESSRPAGMSATIDPPGRTTTWQARGSDQIGTSLRPYRAPDGYVAFDDSEAISRVSSLAKRLVATYPIRREARVMVSARDGAGRPADSLYVGSASIGAEPAVVAAEARDVGVFRLRGIPYFRGVALRLRFASVDDFTLPMEDAVHAPCGEVPGVVLDTGAGIAAWDGALRENPDEWLRLDIRLPASASIDPRLVCAVGGHCSGGHARHSESERPEGTLSLHVRRSDGSPAGNALMAFEPTVDEDERTSRAEREAGVCRLDDEGRLAVALRAGGWRVRLCETGLVPVVGDIVILGGGEQRLDLREPEGATIQVEVVAEDGGSCPFATLRIGQPSGVPWVALDSDGTQRLDAFVDHRGVRTLCRVEPGEIRLTARWCGLTGEVRLSLRDREQGRVRLECRPAARLEPSETVSAR